MECVGIESPDIQAYFLAAVLSYPVLGQRHERTADTLAPSSFRDADAADSTKAHGLKHRVRFSHNADIDESQDLSVLLRDDSDCVLFADATQPVHSISIMHSRTSKNIRECMVVYSIHFFAK
jgi:hypothetical protein